MSRAEGAGLQADLLAVLCWLADERPPPLQKSQRHAGWRWLVRSARRLKLARAASAAPWPVPLERLLIGGSTWWC